jgi:hypothetical protein
MSNLDENKPPLGDYRPVKTGWQRSEELEDDELEHRGRIGLVLTAIVILVALCLPFALSLLFN